MSSHEKFTVDELDAEMKQALGNFKASVDAWSDAAYHRPRVVQAVRHRSWRLAASCALGCVLVAGSLSGDMYEREHRQQAARAAEQARQQQLATAERNRVNDEDLLATVDNDLSRQVPSAMEPLAQLMDDNADQ